MKYLLLLAALSLLNLRGIAQVIPPLPDPIDADRFDDAGDRDRYELRRLRDPATGEIPRRIRARELAFARNIPAREDAQRSLKGGNNVALATAWSMRGPWSIGGRTRALAVDVTNDNTLLAGGISGGVWRSTNAGQAWIRTNGYSGMQGASCIAQDVRPGKQQVWYYGTGELFGNSASGISGTAYYGNGIFKSVDGGRSWNALPATTEGSDFVFDQPFDYVFNIATDPSQPTADVVYAATYGRIMRSSDGGTTWSPTIGVGGDVTTFTDVHVTATGVVYAALAVTGQSNPVGQGILRSTDGVNWKNITPPGFPSTTRRIVITSPPSNRNVLYVLANLSLSKGAAAHALWKYTYLSGDGTGSGGLWQNLSSNIPSGFDSQQSYDLLVKVKPDDANVVFIGGVYVYRSTDGFSTSSNVSSIGGYTANFHPDEHVLVFPSANPAVMYAGNDGGVFKTSNNLASTVNWTPLNNGYINGQFYSIALDHATPGSVMIAGGMQDNGSYYSLNSNPTIDWNNALGGDGTYCAIGNGARSMIASWQHGNIYRLVLDASGNSTGSTRVDPGGPESDYLFIHPFVLDANNSNIMYLPKGDQLWRNSDLSAIPMGSWNSTTKNWTQLTAATVSQSVVTALATSKNLPTNRLYYGTDGGAIYRMDNANTGQPSPVNISAGRGLPSAYVSCIAVDPANGDHAMVVFSNYGVKSVFYTSNGGTSWTAVGGNLEQNSDGSGDGPSCRWAAFITVGGRTVYLVGTSIGLFSTTSLNGDFTYWLQEGKTAIGNTVVDMIDTRSADGYVAVASHGLGAFSATMTGAGSAPEMPALTAPMAGSTDVHIPAPLAWTGVSGDVSYHVQASLSPAFTSPVEMDVVGKTTTSMPGLQNDTTYYWRVRAVNASGASAFTSPWTFTTIPGAPLPPTPIAPATGSGNVPADVQLAWSRVANASSYRLQVAKQFTFTAIVYSDSTLTDTTQLVTGLTSGQRYYWRVSSANQYGRSTNSSLANFTVGSAAVDDNTTTPASALLAQNYPDPFATRTVIRFQIPSREEATLTVRDALGRTVATLINTTLDAGTYEHLFDRGALPAGVYYTHLSVHGASYTRSMIIVSQ